MNNKGSKVIIILNIVSFVCGVLALILFFNGNVGFENPIVWIMCLIVLSSISTLITQFFNSKK